LLEREEKNPSENALGQQKKERRIQWDE
jgi:hypothetical protein